MTTPTRRRYLLSLAAGASALAGCGSDSGGDEPGTGRTDDRIEGPGEATGTPTSTPDSTDAPCATLDPDERSVDAFPDDVTVLSGTLVDRAGDPITPGTVFANSRSDRGNRTRLDTNGEFYLPMAADERYTVDFATYCPDDSSDDLPDFYALGTVDGSSDADLGAVTLPKAHYLGVTVETPDSTEVTSQARIEIRQGGRDESSSPPEPTYPLQDSRAEVIGNVLVTATYEGASASKVYSVDRNRFVRMTVG